MNNTRLVLSNETQAAAQSMLLLRQHEQWMGIDVKWVQGVLKHWEVTEVPLAPSEVLGLMNLRGRIVTLLDLAACLAITSPADEAGIPPRKMGVVIERGAESYCLAVEWVGDVVHVLPEETAELPTHLDARLRERAAGLFRHEGKLVVQLDPEKLTAYGHKQLDEEI